MGTIAVAALVGGVCWTPPAGAATATLTDGSGDVTDDSGDGVTDRTVDITGVTVVNTATELTATLKVSQVVAFDDEAWSNLEYDLGVVLQDAGDPDSDPIIWVATVFDGDASGLLLWSGGACETDLSQTSSAYVFHVDGSCLASTPRSVEYGAIAMHLDGDAIHMDQAPDGDELAPAVAAAEQGVAARLAGTDRTLTAIALSTNRFPDDASAGAVVLAAAGSFPDALAGGPLAAATGAPLLLTGPTGLDARVKAEMQRVLEPGGDVYVLGGTAALGDQVVTDVRSAGFTPQRVAGPSRFETAIAIADEIDGAGFEHDEVLVADGMSFTDALVAGAAAPSGYGVVVLTSGSTMPASTADYLAHDDTTHIAIGAAASTAATGVRSITGASPSELSANVADELVPIHGSVAVASQASFADALAGGPLIATRGGPLLLTDPQTLSTATRDAIESADGSLRQVVVFGGTAAVSAGVLQAIDTALAP